VKKEKIWHLDLVDRRRIDAWKLMVRGEVNKTEISRQTKLCVPAVTRVWKNWFYGNKLILGSMLEPYHKEEEINFIREYFAKPENKGKVAGNLRVDFKQKF
jgi:hypothetical protein